MHIQYAVFINSVMYYLLLALLYDVNIFNYGVYSHTKQMAA